MQTQDALLLDIRPEAQRVDKGVAELRRGALGKGAAVPPVRVRGRRAAGGTGSLWQRVHHACTWALCRGRCSSCGCCATKLWAVSRVGAPLAAAPSAHRLAPLLAPQLLPSVGRRVRDPSGVALEIQALEVAALAKVRAGSTKVIVMDQQASHLHLRCLPGTCCA